MTIVATIAALLVILFGFVVVFGAPYVPTKPTELRRAFDELYEFKAHDLLVDIGSGDGVVLREAARRGARAVGYEINPLLVFISRWLSRGNRRVVIKQANLWKVDFPAETTIVYVFGESRDIRKMAKKVQQQATKLGRDLAFISYGFQLPDMTPIKQSGAHFLYTIEHTSLS